MEPQNVFTNDVSGGRPSVTTGGKLGHSEVVQEGIQPNINLESKNIVAISKHITALYYAAIYFLQLKHASHDTVLEKASQAIATHVLI